MVEIDKSKSFRHNMQMGVSKETLMQYYGIGSDADWNKIMESIKTAMAKMLRKKIIMGKEKTEGNQCQ